MHPLDPRHIEEGIMAVIPWQPGQPRVITVEFDGTRPQTVTPIGWFVYQPTLSRDPFPILPPIPDFDICDCLIGLLLDDGRVLCLDDKVTRESVSDYVKHVKRRYADQQAYVKKNFTASKE